MSETITVAEIRQPQPGQKKGAIKDTSGRTWYVWADKMYLIAQGASYLIEQYDTYRTDRGNVLNTIRSFKTIDGVANRQQSTTQTMVRPATPPPSNNEYRMDIFICGAINNMLSNQNVQPMDLTMMDMVDAIHKFRSAWLAVFGPSPLPRQQTPQRQSSISTGSIAAQQGTIQNNDDMNDEIPF